MTALSGVRKWYIIEHVQFGEDIPYTYAVISPSAQGVSSDIEDDQIRVEDEGTQALHCRNQVVRNTQ